MIYKVNGHADYFSVYPKKVSTEKPSGAQPAYGAALQTGDSIEISENAAFRTKMEAYRKESVQSMSAAPQQRLDALKQEYANDNCPVSDEDVAGALLQYFRGREIF